jgi:hypothetical protein
MPPDGRSSTATFGGGAKSVLRGGWHATDSLLLHGGSTRLTHDEVATTHG